MLRILAAVFLVGLASASLAAPANKSYLKKPNGERVLAPAGPFSYSPEPSDIVIGKPEAPVTIVEYASLSCPHCAHFYNHVLPDLDAKYLVTGKAKLVYRDFPLNDPALKAAELVHCAPKDRRAAFLKVLFGNQERWAYDLAYRQALANIAVLGGIDRAQFDHCLGDKANEKAVLTEAKAAEDKFKISSTPTLFVGDKEVPGDHDLATLSRLIDAELAKK